MAALLIQPADEGPGSASYHKSNLLNLHLALTALTASWVQQARCPVAMQSS